MKTPTTFKVDPRSTKSVLILEDQEDTALTLKDRLYGWDVHLASNIFEAENIIEKQQLELAIIDIRIDTYVKAGTLTAGGRRVDAHHRQERPLGGVAVIRTIRKSKKSPNARIVAYTNAAAFVSEECKRAGCNVVVDKSEGVFALLDAIGGSSLFEAGCLAISTIEGQPPTVKIDGHPVDIKSRKHKLVRILRYICQYSPVDENRLLDYCEERGFFDQQSKSAETDLEARQRNLLDQWVTRINRKLTKVYDPESQKIHHFISRTDPQYHINLPAKSDQPKENE